jgi:hypothetical protein
MESGYERLVRILLGSNSSWMNENEFTGAIVTWSLFAYYANVWSWLDFFLIFFVGAIHFPQASSVDDNSLISDSSTGRPLHDTKGKIGVSPVVLLAVGFFLQYLTYLTDVKPLIGSQAVPATQRLMQGPVPSWSASSWLFLSLNSSLFSRHIPAARTATYAEVYLAEAFREYLAFSVQGSRKPLQVRYTAAGTHSVETETFESQAFIEMGLSTLSAEIDAPVPTTVSTAPAQRDVMEFRVLTPEFYTRFVHYSHDIEALFAEMFNMGTISISRPDLLPDIFVKPQMDPWTVWRPTDYLFFKLIEQLRTIPASQYASRLAGKQAANITEVDIRSFRPSSMDSFILKQDTFSSPGCPTAKLRHSYRSVVARLFLANRFLGGNLWLLTMLDLGVHLCIAYILVRITLPLD